MVFEAIKVRIFGLRSPNHAPRGGGAGIRQESARVTRVTRP